MCEFVQLVLYIHNDLLLYNFMVCAFALCFRFKGGISRFEPVLSAHFNDWLQLSIGGLIRPNENDRSWELAVLFF